MELPHDLLEFMRTHRDELTLSVYVESAPADPVARRNWRVHLRHALANVRETLLPAHPDEQDAFERCAAAVLGRLPTGDATPSSQGWACFATAGGSTLTLSLTDATAEAVAWGVGVRGTSTLRAHSHGEALVLRIEQPVTRDFGWPSRAPTDHRSLTDLRFPISAHP